MKTLVSIVGTRPNYIKLAQLDKPLKKNFNHVIVDTGQHYDNELSVNFFKEYKITKPKYVLKVNKAGGSEQIAHMLNGCTKVLIKEKPKAVIVYGDTNSTLAGAIAASKLNVSIFHQEAGIRSYDLNSPEEVNRRIVDSVSQYLLCPTKQAQQNLLNEGKEGVFVGDIMFDLYKKAKTNVKIVKKYNLVSKKYYFVTIHRQENTQDPKRIVSILNALVGLNKTLIFPVHPRTKKIVKGLKFKKQNIIMCEPLSHLENLSLIRNCQFVLTDSGGIQKEAFWSKVPCITIRKKTEWPETVKSGWNMLVDDPKLINQAIDKFKRPRAHPNYFGNGDASANTVKYIKKILDSQP